MGNNNNSSGLGIYIFAFVMIAGVGFMSYQIYNSDKIIPSLKNNKNENQ